MLTLTQLSELSGIQIATLSRMENGKMTGTLEAYEKIAGVYEVKLWELFREMG